MRNELEHIDSRTETKRKNCASRNQGRDRRELTALGWEPRSKRLAQAKHRN